MFQKLAMAVCFGAIVAACSGGAGSGISPGPSTDRAATGPEGTTGGSEAAGSSGDTGGCAPCRGFYQCSGVIQGKAINGGVTFSSNSSACAPNQVQKDDSVFLACGGSIVSGPKAEGLPPNTVVGRWTDVGGGTLVACIRINGTEDCITCTPSTEPVTMSGGSDGGVRRRDGG